MLKTLFNSQELLFRFLLTIFLFYFTTTNGSLISSIDSITTQDIIAGDVFFEIIEPTELEYTYRVRPAKDFGTPFNASFKAFKVGLVPTIPFDACTTDFVNADEIIGNIAFVERGECSFLTKTINVEKIGAIAVIITETENISDYEYYIEMVHDTTNRDANIPAAFLLGKNGRIIRKTLMKLKRKFALINLPINLTFTPPHQINHPPWMGW